MAKIKYWILTGFKLIVLMLAFLFILTKCGGCDNNIKVEKTNKDSLFAIIKAKSLRVVELEKSLLLSELKNKELDSVKIKVENDYAIASKKLRAKLKVNICDTQQVIIVLNKCDSVIEANHSIIHQRDTTIKILKETIKEQDSIIVSSRGVIIKQDKDYNKLEKTSQKALKKQKWITRLVIIGDVIKDVLLVFTLK